MRLNSRAQVEGPPVKYICIKKNVEDLRLCLTCSSARVEVYTVCTLYSVQFTLCGSLMVGLYQRVLNGSSYMTRLY